MSMPADSPPGGWQPSLVDERGFTHTTSFTQQDVNDGAVWYRHFGSGHNSDSFQFQVRDDSSLKSVLVTLARESQSQTPGFGLS